jgi:hypothetical protein
MCGAVTPISQAKACSGKCLGGGCRRASRVWVVAACEGMVSLFTKNDSGAISPLPSENQPVFASLDAFQKSLSTAEEQHAFDQLIIVGSNNDIAWVHASMPAHATQHVVAEIEYPLLPNWFKQSLPLATLTHALEGVFAD